MASQKVFGLIITPQKKIDKPESSNKMMLLLQFIQTRWFLFYEGWRDGETYFSYFQLEFVRLCAKRFAPFWTFQNITLCLDIETPGEHRCVLNPHTSPEAWLSDLLGVPNSHHQVWLEDFGWLRVLFSFKHVQTLDLPPSNGRLLKLRPIFVVFWLMLVECLKFLKGQNGPSLAIFLKHQPWLTLGSPTKSWDWSYFSEAKPWDA